MAVVTVLIALSAAVLGGIGTVRLLLRPDSLSHVVSGLGLVAVAVALAVPL